MMKLLLLIAAVGGGGVLMHHVANSPGALTLSDVGQAAEQGMKSAESAAATAGSAVETATDVARTGMRAAESAASLLGDVVDTGSALADDARRVLTPPQAASKPRLVLEVRQSRSGGLGVRPGAADVLPVERVLPAAAPAETVEEE